MIVSLSGVVSAKLGNLVVLEVQGVGYGVLVTNEDFAGLKQDQEAKVYIYDHIRENLHELYGFLHTDTKALFEKLLDVTGVGPRMALSILSIGSVANVQAAIAGGDVTYIQQASGVGKRLAERIIVELKDKVGLVSADIKSMGILQSESSLGEDEAAQGLISLGYSPQDALNALKSIDPDLPTEERIRQALKGVKR